MHPSSINSTRSMLILLLRLGLSLVGYPGLQDIDPVYCMPAKVIDKLGLRKEYRTLRRMASYPS
jgi:hypothetical protein